MSTFKYSLQPPPAERPSFSPGYGVENTAPEGLLPWEWVTERLSNSRNYWVCTTGADCRPHAMPVWGVWLGDGVYFSTDRSSRKGRNLSVDARISLHLESGDEVVIIESAAREVTDLDVLDEMAEQYELKYPGTGLKPEDLNSATNITYVVRPGTVLAWMEKDFLNTATRWRFGQKHA
jgi:hypothetical protein